MFVSKEILHQILACSPVLCLHFLVGTLHGWMSPTMAKMRDRNSEFYATADQASWFASLHEAGKVMATFVSPLLVDHLGRKRTLVLVAVVYLVVWSCTIFARSIYTLCTLRVLFGLGNAVNNVVSGIYTTENCSPRLRGIFASFVLLLLHTAVFVECVIATYLPFWTMATVNTAMAACALLTTLGYGVETPSFLIMKGKREEAEKNLIWLSGGRTLDNKRTNEELQRIEQIMAQQKLKKRSFVELLSSPANVKGIVLVVSMNVLAMAKGGSAYGTYAPIIFQPSETFTTGEYTILQCATSVVGVAISVFIVEKIDRRSLVIAGNLGSTLCNVSSFLLIYFRGRGLTVAAYPWLIFASVASFSMFEALMSPAGFALKGELLPFSVRAIGNSMAVVGFSISSFTASKTFLPVTERYGMETNFLVYSAVSLFTTVFLYYFLPETRGKTLHELQNLQKGERITTEKQPCEGGV